MELTAGLIEARCPARILPDVPAPPVPEAELRRGAATVLAEREGDGIWIFAYGALIWEHDYTSDEERVGTLPGMARRYCLRDVSNRGTPGHPSLTLGLVPADDACPGVLVHLAERGLERNFWAVWTHEMSGGLYKPQWVRVQSEGDMVEALTFVADAAHPSYVADLPEDGVAAVLAATAGQGGPAADYLRLTASAMTDRGAPDPYLDRLAAAVAARLQPAA